MKINVSFKNTDEEVKLYLEIIQHSDKSCFIKDAVRYYLNKSNPCHKQYAEKT